MLWNLYLKHGYKPCWIRLEHRRIWGKRYGITKLVGAGLNPKIGDNDDVERNPLTLMKIIVL